MEYKVSVILPSLNVGGYIDECIKSVVNQSLEEIEIICVDAGSTDDTLNVINDYMMKDNRIRLIKSEIKSYGYQVNRGIEKAKGKYIAIVDTDDFIHGDMYRVLYNAAYEDGFPDFVKADHDMFIELNRNERLYKRKTVFNEKNKNIYNKVISPKCWPRLIVMDCYVWNGIYRKDFLIEKNIRMNETAGAAFQDNGFTFQSIILAERCKYVNYSGYRYRRDNENASVFSAKSLSCLYEEYEFIFSFMKNKHRESRYFSAMYYKRYYDFLRFEIEVAIRKGTNLREHLEILNRIGARFKEGYSDKSLDVGVFTNLYWYELNHLLVDCERYIDFIEDWFNAQRKLMLDFIQKVRHLDNVILFGSGNVGGTVAAILKKNGLNNIRAWCDNNNKKWGLVYIDKEILSLSEAINRYSNDASYIITAVDYKDEIWAQLVDAGINPDKIIYCPLGDNPLPFLISL